jgi:hypothetical protein
MLWGCIAIFAIINKPLRGAVAAAVGALLALFGVIHAPVVGFAEGSSLMFVTAYLMMGGMFVVKHVLDSATPGERADANQNAPKEQMKELMVVAIGGNSIIKDNASQSIEHQAQAVKAVAESVLEMLASDYDIVLTHGNGRWGWICAAPKSPTSGKGCR